MNPPPRQSYSHNGSTLIEAAITIGVLAVVIPLVYGAMAEAGKCGMSAAAETRCICMIPVCIEEIHASRDGKPHFFTATIVGQTFPPAGDVWALAFCADGKPVGRLTQSAYQQGTRDLNGKPVSYIATMSCVGDSTTPDTLSPAMPVRITLSYPASAPATQRQSLEFNTRIP